MPICFLKKSSGTKAADAAPAAEPSKPKPSPPSEAAGIMEHIITPGAGYSSSQPRRLRNIIYNFNDGQYDDDYYGSQDEMYYPNQGGYHPHAVVAPVPYHPGPGMRHMSARSSMPPPHSHCDCHSNYYMQPPPPHYGHYPPAPQRHFSPAPPPWHSFSPAPPPPPPQWGQFGPPRPQFGPPRRPYAPPPSYDYYGEY